MMCTAKDRTSVSSLSDGLAAAFIPVFCLLGEWGPDRLGFDLSLGMA